MKAECSSRFSSGNPDYWKEWQKTPKGRSCSRRVLLSSYRLTEEQFDALMKSQRGRCAICKKKGGWKANGGRLVIDHCHGRGHVRGPLCPSCNRGLGQFEDNPTLLESARNYVNREIEKRDGKAIPPEA